MAITSFRTVFNRVLVNLREPELSSSATALTDDYHLLLRNFWNTIRDEVQLAHQWSSLRYYCTATVAADAAKSGQVVIADGDISSYHTVVVLNSATLARQVYPQNGCIKPLAFDVTDTSNPLELNEYDLKEVLRRQILNTDSGDSIQGFAIDPDFNSLVVQVFPRPSTQRTIQLELYCPQDVINASDAAADIDYYINLPLGAIKAIEIGTTWYALEERGEELGTNSPFTEQRYREALTTAIAAEDATSGGDKYQMVLV